MGSIMYMGREYSGVSGVQFSSIPDPTMELLGKIIQYVGPNTRDYANGLFYKCIKNDDIIFWAPISVQAGSGSGETIQYITLPDPTAELAGKIYQYIGPDTSLYTNGYFYKCIKFGSEYKWTKINVQDGSGSGDTTQYDILPVPSSSLKGKIYQYVGETNTLYTNGYFYKCIENNGMYVWKVVKVSGEEDPRFIQPITYSDELIGQTLTITKGSSTVLETVLDNSGITFYKGYETGTYTYSIIEYSISETREYSILDAQYPEINLTTLNYFTQPISYEEDLIGQTLTVRKGTSVVLEYELDETGVYFFKESEVGTYEFLVDGAGSSYVREYLVLGETYPEIRFTKQELLYFTQPINYTDELIGKSLTVSKDGSTVLETVLDDTKRYLFKGYETGTYTFNIDSASEPQTREYTNLDVTYSDISFDILRAFIQPIRYDSVYVGDTLTVEYQGTTVFTHVLDDSGYYEYIGYELGDYRISVSGCKIAYNITVLELEPISREMQFNESDRWKFSQYISYDQLLIGETLTITSITEGKVLVSEVLDSSYSYHFEGIKSGTYKYEMTNSTDVYTLEQDIHSEYTTLQFHGMPKIFTQPITYDSVYIGQTLTIKKSGTTVLEQVLDNSGSYNYEGNETGSYSFSISLCSKEYTRTINSYQMQSSIHFYESDREFFTLPIRYDSVYNGQTLTIKCYGTTVLTQELDNSGLYTFKGTDQGKYVITLTGCAAIIEKSIFVYEVLPEIYFKEEDRVHFTQPIRYDSTYNGKTLTVKHSGTTVLSRQLDNSGSYTFIGYETGSYSYTVSNKTFSRRYISYGDQSEIYFGLTISSFETAPSTEIVDILERYYANELSQETIDSLKNTYWPVGATRQITLEEMSATGVSDSHVSNTYTFVILDHEHDDLTTPINGHTKAFITLGQVEVLSDADGKSEDGPIGSPYKWFNNCPRRTWCNDVYYNAIPGTIRNSVKSVNKYSCDGSNYDSPQLVTTSDKVFLLSVYEVTGSTVRVGGDENLLTLLPEGNMYPYFETITNRSKLSKKSYYKEWWLRSMFSNWDNHVCYYKSSTSKPYADEELGTRSKSLAPAFCL